MALGAWLPLFQTLTAPGTAGTAAGSSVIGGAELLTTFPPNTLALTGFFDSTIPEIAKHNAQALVKGASADSLTADQSVTAGHKHEGTHEAVLRWRQLASYIFATNSQYPTIPAETYPVDAIALYSATEQKLAMGVLWIGEEEAASVVPRVRVSFDNDVSCNAYLLLRYYDRERTLFLTTAPAFSFLTDVVEERVWHEGDAVDLRAALADAAVPSRKMIVWELTGYLVPSTEQIAIHELSFGVEQ